MEKFFKNFFNSTDKRSSRNHDISDELREDFNPPMDGRRKLSISRSGRMKQANKKRASLTIDLYGEDLHMQEKPSSKEYHVHGKTFTKEKKELADDNKNKSKDSDVNTDRCKLERRHSTSNVSPEEEIDNAFEIIDKT